MTFENDIPEQVARALIRARTLGFDLSCENTVGQLLATLAAERIRQTSSPSNGGSMFMFSNVNAPAAARATGSVVAA